MGPRRQRGLHRGARARTRGIDLGGRAFLHDYDWRQDSGFGVLELIMTAPMVVASWINLQYYGSTVNNRVFGAATRCCTTFPARSAFWKATPAI